MDRSAFGGPDIGYCAAPQQVSRVSEPSGDTVLVVDDEAEVRQVLHDILTRGGYHVITAAGGVAALAACAGQPVPRLLVTDVTMPGVDGRAVARQARTRLPNLAVLFVSGTVAPRARHHHTHGGRTRFLATPFTPQELLDSAAALLGIAR